MENNDKTLDKLFVSEDEVTNQADNVEKSVVNTKEEDIKSINKDANALAKQFNKKNRKNLNKIKKEEDLRIAEEEEMENNKIAKERKSKVVAILGLLEFPFVLLGGVIVWNYYIAEQTFNTIAILTALMCITTFAVGIKAFIKGIMKKSAFKRKIGSVCFGLLSLSVSVAIVIFREYIENFAFIISGAFSCFIGFLALLIISFKRKKTGYDVFNIIVSVLVFVSSIMLILAGVMTVQIEVYMKILGILLTVVGCVLFAF